MEPCDMIHLPFRLVVSFGWVVAPSRCTPFTTRPAAVGSRGEGHEKYGRDRWLRMLVRGAWVGSSSRGGWGAWDRRLGRLRGWPELHRALLLPGGPAGTFEKGSEAILAPVSPATRLHLASLKATWPDRV
jgi:hypothetical protein